MASDDSTIPLFKICTACHQEKALLQFGKHRLGKHGRRSTCLVCHNAAGRQWKAANKPRRARVNQSWKQRNRSKQKTYRIRAAQRASEEQKARTKARDALRRRTKREHIKKSKKLWELKNPEALQAIKQREYEKHKESYIARTRRFQAKNPHLVRLYAKIAGQRRRAGGVILGRVAVREAILETLEAYRIGDRYWDVYEGRLIEKPTIDHVVPVGQGGPTLAENLCVTSRAANASKGKKSLLIWLARRLQQQPILKGIAPSQDVSSGTLSQSSTL